MAAHLLVCFLVVLLCPCYSEPSKEAAFQKPFLVYSSMGGKGLLYKPHWHEWAFCAAFIFLGLLWKATPRALCA